MQQVGGSIGIALLSTLAASATTAFLVGKHASPLNLAAAATRGYDIAFWWAAGILAAGAVATFFLFGGEAPATKPGLENEVEAEAEFIAVF
jgi:hypothetical protein